MTRAHVASTRTNELDGANVVVLVGEVSASPRRRELPSGIDVVEFDVTTRGESGTASVPVVWSQPGAPSDNLDVGNPVVVAGHVRRRFFRVGGATQTRTEVVAARVLVSRRSASAGRLMAQVAALLTDRPVR